MRGHQGFQADESRVLTKDILDNPDDFCMAIERYSCSVVSIIGWGRRISRKDDPIVERALEFMHTAAQIFVPGDYWMETIPLLSYLPSWLYSLPTQLRMGKNAMARYWYALSKEGAEESTENCFSKHVLALEKEGVQLEPEEIAGLTGNLIGGGVDTTTSTMLSLILAAVAFPEAIKPAQEEIDKHVGWDKSPDWSDEGNLVYCKALIREVLRWRSVAILGGLPHAPTRDDMYRGYLIPKGTSIMVRRPFFIRTNGRVISGLFIVIQENFQSQMYSNRNDISKRIALPIPMNEDTTHLASVVVNAVVNPLRSRDCILLSAAFFGHSISSPPSTKMYIPGSETVAEFLGERDPGGYLCIHRWREYASSAIPSEVYSA